MNSGDDCVNSDGFGFQRVRVDSGDPILDSPVAGDIPNHLLDILDDTDNVADRETAMQGLDSVIKSFEEEILASGSDPGMVYPDPIPDSGELQLDLGYLLEASDDELGLPPSVVSGEGAKPETEDFIRVGSDEIGFENETAKYEPVGLTGTEDDRNGGIVNFEGLLDFPEPYDVLWRSESLQAM